MLQDGNTLIAKDQDEALYWQSAENTKEHIKLLNLRIDGAKRNLKKTDREIVQKFRKGAKESIKEMEREKKMQKEVLKFFMSKIENAP